MMYKERLCNHKRVKTVEIKDAIVFAPHGVPYQIYKDMNGNLYHDADDGSEDIMKCRTNDVAEAMVDLKEYLEA